MKTPRAVKVALLLTTFATLGLDAFVLPVPAARATITGIQVIPANPTVADSVDVRVTGLFLDGCWSVGPADCGLASNSISIAVYAADSWQPGVTCLLLIVDYDETCHYGRLPAGDYHIVFTEFHLSLRDPNPRQASLDFSVGSGPTPAARTTWGRLKALYR